MAFSSTTLTGIATGSIVSSGRYETTILVCPTPTECTIPLASTEAIDSFSEEKLRSSKFAGNVEPSVMLYDTLIWEVPPSSVKLRNEGDTAKDETFLSSKTTGTETSGRSSYFMIISVFPVS